MLMGVCTVKRVVGGASPGDRVRKLKAMLPRGTRVTMQLSPLVSMKSWRVMAVGSM